MSSPILYHFFRTPLPYARTLALQEQIHALQLSQRQLGAHKDVLLLLEHRPVYTAGRRQNQDSVRDEKLRLTNIGADFISTSRGGELTYHGPGQIVGYPLLDLSRYSPTMGIRDYICRMQKTLELHLRQNHGIAPCTSEHTGVFLNPTTKIGSIGVQVRHRLTTHGFSLNITAEPVAWFNQVVACGLADVRAGSIEGVKGRPISLKDEIPGLVELFGKLYEREMVEMDTSNEGELGQAVQEMEEEARRVGSWATAPIESPVP
ncbi:lipoyltransferase [Gymnopus androsaceus JB14]|uniref:Octanoyltransferase n=1 Tax=Gymnopus androsaceus JB14 TaxID=1447944 RepID=A0A6A4HR90_9AGAR|nr:lipoyltransferase [Gymnopus androsaceus JB14]